VPRTGNQADQPAQTINDLNVSAQVWRNGGSDRTTHLCDECIRVAVRAIKVRLDAALDTLDEGHDLQSELVATTRRLASLQSEHHNLTFDHNRMQERLGALLKIVDPMAAIDSEVFRFARWEANRGPARDNL